MERDGKPEASEEAGERDWGLNSHHGTNGTEANSSSGHWVEKMDHNSRLAREPWGAGWGCRDAGALGCFPSGSYSYAPGQPVGVPALALPVSSGVAWTLYLGALLCPLEKTGLIPGRPREMAMRSQGVNISSESLDKSLA